MKIIILNDFNTIILLLEIRFHVYLKKSNNIIQNDSKRNIIKILVIIKYPITIKRPAFYRYLLTDSNSVGNIMMDH